MHYINKYLAAPNALLASTFLDNARVGHGQISVAIKESSDHLSRLILYFDIDDRLGRYTDSDICVVLGDYFYAFE